MRSSSFDALAISFTSIQLRPAVMALLQDIGAKRGSGEGRRFPLISHSGLPRNAARLIGKFRRAGLTVYLRNITSTAGIPSIDCTLVEELTDGQHFVHGGCGTHPDARVALIRALTEGAQSRVACIQGGREDLPEIVHPPRTVDPSDVFGTAETTSFTEIKSWQHDFIDDDVRFLLRRMKSAGFDKVIAVDLTRPELRIPVIRIIVPRAEAWTVFHLHTERGIFGQRVTNELVSRA